MGLVCQYAYALGSGRPFRIRSLLFYQARDFRFSKLHFLKSVLVSYPPKLVIPNHLSYSSRPSWNKDTLIILEKYNIFKTFDFTWSKWAFNHSLNYLRLEPSSCCIDWHPLWFFEPFSYDLNCEKLTSVEGQITPSTTDTCLNGDQARVPQKEVPSVSAMTLWRHYEPLHTWLVTLRSVLNLAVMHSPKFFSLEQHLNSCWAWSCQCDLAFHCRVNFSKLARRKMAENIDLLSIDAKLDTLYAYMVKFTVENQFSIKNARLNCSHEDKSTGKRIYPKTYLKQKHVHF